MKKYLIIGLISVIALEGIYIGFLLTQGQTFKGISPALSRFNDIATSSVLTISGDIRILATSTTRTFVSICNDGANKVYLGISSDKAITANALGTFNASIIMAANTCYVFNNDNLYTGSIRASSTVSSTLNVTEVRSAY